ncbi:MAG: hypothetical protein AVDCRST_MAG93-9413, partial [uncultured Chloroflexia bacterium]
MQKRKFDLRDRTGRLRAIQSLGTQVSRVRQVRPRAEYIVPAICLLVLALALTWNALSPTAGPSLGVDSTAVSGTEVAVIVTADPLATPNIGGIGPTPSPVLTDGSGYPAPEESEGPVR